MEEKIVNLNEYEDIEQNEDLVEVSESSDNTGAFVAGALGGVLAYAVISMGGKAIKWVGSKVAGFREKRKNKNVIDTTIVEDSDEQKSEEEDSDK